MQANDSALKLLVVDDDLIVRESLVGLLEELGHTIVQASGGREGIELSRTEHPDMIFVDLRMPEVDGLEVLDAVSRESPETPLVVVSGASLIDEAMEAVTRGAWDYMTKPIQDIGLIQHTIAKAMEKRDLLQENRRHHESLEQEIQLRTEELREELAARRRAEADRAEVREQLRQSQKMEAIGQLAGGVAHDFNNLLTAIQGSAQLMQMRGNLDDKDAVGAERIMTASLRATDLTHQLLSFARKGKQQAIACDIHAIITEVIHILTHSVDRLIEIRTDLVASPPALIGDPTQIQNALLNLSVNARDAMPEGGILLLATRTICVEEGDLRRGEYNLPSGQYLEISVSDNGMGMDAATQNRIFEPFFTTKAPGKGTGLGLAAVYGCVTSHNGAINVCSELERGTIFTIALPCAAVAKETDLDTLEEDTQHGTGHILIVDDEEIIRDIVTTALQSAGYTAATAANGEEAIAYCRDHGAEADLIILDLIMPKVSARETFDGIREVAPQARILITSGYTSPEATNELISKGALGLLSKPFSIKKLCSEVARCLRTEPG
jgi:signal transduction histidine kinase